MRYRLAMVYASRYYSAMSTTDLLTVRQAAEKLGVSKSRVHFFLQQGRLKALIRLERLGIRPAELERFAAIKRVTGHPLKKTSRNGKNPG